MKHKQGQKQCHLLRNINCFQTIQNYTLHIWRLTNEYNVLRPREWKERVSGLMLLYQEDVIDNVKDGYVGNLPDERVWTLSSSLMFSLTVFTTIGKAISPQNVDNIKIFIFSRLRKSDS